LGTYNASDYRREGKELHEFPQELCSEQASSIITVQLSHNHIPNIPSLAVERLVSLRVLDLSNNELTRIPEDFGKLHSLVQLDLSYNHLTILPDSISSLRFLHTLSLRGNQLSELSNGIAHLTALRKLDLKSNFLRELPASIAQLDGLVELDVSQNSLVELPKNIGGMTSLVRLNACFNQISRIPESIMNCQQLVVIKLAVNNLTHVPHEVGYLPRLSWFSMSSCPAALPADLPRPQVVDIPMSELKMGRVLRTGVNSTIHSAKWQDEQVVVKVFKEVAGPSGSAKDEMMISAILDHPACTRALATVTEPQMALVMKEFPGKPFEERDGHRQDRVLGATGMPGKPIQREAIIHAANCVVSGLRHIHSLGICHGDMHAHSVLVDVEGGASIHDFSTAFRYHPEERCVWEPVDVRGFGVALLAMVNRATEEEEDIRALAEDCLGVNPMERPDLETIAGRLTRISYGKFV